MSSGRSDHRGLKRHLVLVAEALLLFAMHGFLWSLGSVFMAVIKAWSSEIRLGRVVDLR